MLKNMKVEKNIELGIKKDGMEKQEIDESVDEMIKIVKMEKYGKRKKNKL